MLYVSIKLTLILPLFSLRKNILSPDVTACDIVLTVTDTKQYVATEGYPDSYQNNQDCDFTFEAPSGRRIAVFFEDFQLESPFDHLHFRKWIIH